MGFVTVTISTRTVQCVKNLLTPESYHQPEAWTEVPPVSPTPPAAAHRLPVAVGLPIWAFL